MVNQNLKKISEIQKKLSKRIVEKPLNVEKVKTVGAVDVSYRRNVAKAAFVLCSFPKCEIIKTKIIKTEVTFPYIPTFFFLRETKPVLIALKGEKFDVLLVEGHGKAHPRGFGIASHIGILIQKPTIGVAKKPLRAYPPNSLLRVGKVYISVGNLVDLESAKRIIEGLNEKGYPKPLRVADKLSKGSDHAET